MSKFLKAQAKIKNIGVIFNHHNIFLVQFLFDFINQKRISFLRINKTHNVFSYLFIVIFMYLLKITSNYL